MGLTLSRRMRILLILVLLLGLSGLSRKISALEFAMRTSDPENPEIRFTFHLQKFCSFVTKF